MPSHLPGRLLAPHPPRHIYSMFIALVTLFFLSCVLAFLTPFALMAAYDMFRPLHFLTEFPLNMLEKMLIFPMLLIGAGAGATVTQLVRWSLADTETYRGITE